MSSKIDINLFWMDTSPSQRPIRQSRGEDTLPRFGTIGIAAVAAALAASRPAPSLQLMAPPPAPEPPVRRRG
jgi:hypothetical protein